ncbi:hypothetical protein D5F01_LYC19318 [Larimichthys crocea]|uniref:Uncharacterized protein n=1 Tax=Larimichthys crocea TaxID=215358 RepID=A0A6G0HRT0_LARCR|nr:hypothetical protein D5F01_LYC19318 [Larimichthys crocea]
MQFQRILSIFYILVSMALMVVIFYQYKVTIMLNKRVEDLQSESRALENSYINEELLKGTLEKLVVKGTKVVGDLEGALTSLSETMAKKKTETDTCQAEKKTKGEELTSKEKEQTDTEATIKTESDAWTQEINILKAQLTEFRPICNHVKKNPLVLKLCGNHPS